MGSRDETGDKGLAPRGPDEDARALPMVEIVVRDPGSCPVLFAGGRITYAHPEVLKDESDRICAQALSVLAPAAEEVARAAAAGRRMQPLELSCPEEGCRAVFEMKALPFGTSPQRTQTSQRSQPPVSSGTSVTGSGGSTTITKRLERFASPSTDAGPFLSRLDPELLKEIVDLSTVETYSEPTAIIREGQEGEALYVVAEGELEVFRESEEGRGTVLATPGKGECLGEMSLLTGRPAAATVKTRGSGTVVLVIPKPVFEDLLTRKPALHGVFSRIIAERLYKTNVLLEAKTSHGIAGRLSMIGVVDLIQTLHASHRTGTLTLDTGEDQKARIGFRNGAVTSAVAGELKGAEGVYELLAWRAGGFSFEGGEPEVDSVPGASVELETMALLIEGVRRLDERGEA